MRIIFYIISLFFCSISFSNSNEEYNVDITFLTAAGQTDIMKFGNKLIYRQLKGTASWNDSLGDYGILKCMGNYVSSEKGGTTLNNYCQGSNKNGDAFWLTMIRNSSDFDKGVGKSEYIFGEGKFKNFEGKKCIYAVDIMKDLSILKQKCK